MGSFIQSIVVALSYDFEPYHLVKVLVAGLGIAVPLILAWFAFRWIFSKAKGALKKGS